MIAEGFDVLFENASELDVMFNPEKVIFENINSKLLDIYIVR